MVVEWVDQEGGGLVEEIIGVDQEIITFNKIIINNKILIIITSEREERKRKKKILYLLRLKRDWAQKEVILSNLISDSVMMIILRMIMITTWKKVQDVVEAVDLAGGLEEEGVDAVAFLIAILPLNRLHSCPRVHWFRIPLAEVEAVAEEGVEAEDVEEPEEQRLLNQ